MTRTRLQATEALAGPIGLLAAVCFAIASGVFGWDRWWATATVAAILVAGVALSLLARHARLHWDVAPLEAQRALTAYGRENQRLATQAEWRKAVEDRGLVWIAWDWPDPGTRRPRLYGIGAGSLMAHEAAAYGEANRRRTEYARWAALYGSQIVSYGDAFGYSAVELSYEPTAFERRQECEPPADHQGR